MKKLSVIMGVAVLFAGGCSTIVNGTSQTVYVTTNISTSASCELRDNKTTYQVNAPGNVEVKRGDGPLRVTCKNAAAVGEAFIPETYDPTVVWLGHGGLLVDAITGAYQHYPAQIIVPMTASVAQ